MRLSLLLIAVSLIFPMSNAQVDLKIESSPELERLVEGAVQETLQEFAARGLKPEEIAVTLVDLSHPGEPRRGSYRGSERIYPASVVKLFYLEAAHRWLEEEKLKESEELNRAMRDMIVDSYNEATHYIVDLLTATTSGPELPAAEMSAWEEKRNSVNRYFATRGYDNINVNQKPWCEGPYGRERVFVGKNYTNRNMLTTDAAARLLSEIALGAAVNAERSKAMLDLLRRDPFSPARDQDDQAHGFTGSAVPSGGKLWSKAGWTSQTRHDAAYIELASGRKFVLVTFTINHANTREIIPQVARNVLENWK